LAAHQVPAYAFNQRRGQYNAAAIMKRIAGSRRSNDVAALGVADVDLFMPEEDEPYTFGEADRASLAGIINVSRLLDKDRAATLSDKVLRRLRVATIHELGHLVGLSHCENWKCAMSISTTLAEQDRKGAELCTNCRLAVSRSGSF
jgi:archaemetzincin